MAMNSYSKGNLKLLGYLREHQIKQDRLALILNRNLTTINRKLNGYSEFTVSEVKIIHDELGIPYEVLIN
ncbi:MAG: transcriptional regulator [Lactobacillus sp.]|nr:MAG: transcriptional regulator [Lactobacillus sp.]